MSAVGLGMALMFVLAACPDDKDLLRRGGGVTRDRAARRGLGGTQSEPDLVGMARPLGGGGVARILVQPMEEKLRDGPYVWSLVKEKAEEARGLRRALLASVPGPFRTCPPLWRVDLRYGHVEHVVLVNLPCRRLVLDGQERQYDEAMEKALGPLLREASRRPTHKIFGVRVPVMHEPKAVLPVLAARSTEAYLPELPCRRGPVARMAYVVQERPPADPRNLDRAVADIRKRAYDTLRSYAQHLKVGRQEILDVAGPEPAFERFGDRLFEARYVITVLFRHATPEYQLGFLGLSKDLVVENITVPKDYRVDVVFPGDTKVSEMRNALTWVTLKPPLTVW